MGGRIDTGMGNDKTTTRAEKTKQYAHAKPNGLHVLLFFENATLDVILKFLSPAIRYRRVYENSRC